MSAKLRVSASRVPETVSRNTQLIKFHGSEPFALFAISERTSEPVVKVFPSFIVIVEQAAMFESVDDELGLFGHRSIPIKQDVILRAVNEIVIALFVVGVYGYCCWSEVMNYSFL